MQIGATNHCSSTHQRHNKLATSPRSSRTRRARCQRRNSATGDWESANGSKTSANSRNGSTPGGRARASRKSGSTGSRPPSRGSCGKNSFYPTHLKIGIKSHHLAALIAVIGDPGSRSGPCSRSRSRRSSRPARCACFRRPRSRARSRALLPGSKPSNLSGARSTTASP